MRYLKTERKFNMTKKQNMILEDYKESLDILRINSKGLLLNNNFKQNNDTQSIDRGAINDMGFWYDVIQPLVDEISERYGLSFNQSAKIYQKAWDIAFDKLDNT